jgi:hypothetical protein
MKVPICATVVVVSLPGATPAALVDPPADMAWLAVGGATLVQ